ncbi:hypothetical protein GCM10027341_00370 [Spirosoma knui]
MAALLTTSVAVAQTTPQNAKGNATNATTSAGTKGASATKSASTSKTPASGTAKATTEPSRPLPEHSLKTKLKNDNTNNPNYNLEKARSDRGTKREYTPRRTESGARKDTMDRRKSS